MLPGPVSSNGIQTAVKQSERRFCAHIIGHMRNMYIIIAIMKLSALKTRIAVCSFHSVAELYGAEPFLSTVFDQKFAALSKSAEFLTARPGLFVENRRGLWYDNSTI